MHAGPERKAKKEERDTAGTYDSEDTVEPLSPVWTLCPTGDRPINTRSHRRYLRINTETRRARPIGLDRSPTRAFRCEDAGGSKGFRLGTVTAYINHVNSCVRRIAESLGDNASYVKVESAETGASSHLTFRRVSAQGGRAARPDQKPAGGAEGTAAAATLAVGGRAL